jgi:hypothetical protein
LHLSIVIGIGDADFERHHIPMGVRHMATKKQAAKPGRSSGTLAVLRRRAEAMMGRLRRAGMQQVRTIERQIDRLNQQRQDLLSELGAAVGGASRRGAGRRASGVGSRKRVEWDAVFAKLPKTSFKASDVRALVPGVAAGTLSQRLTGWVNEKKLKRTGTRRGTRYVRIS